MNIYEAFKIIRDKGLILEREMSPEQIEAAKKRRQARRAENRGAPVNAGTFAVILGNGYPTPEFFRDHMPVGTSDQVLKTIDQNRHRYKYQQILGFYPTRKKAMEVAISVMERILKTQKSAYDVEYTPLPYVVNVSEENKRWREAIALPGDRGFLYNRDEDAFREVFDMRDAKLKEIEETEKRDEEKLARDREQYNPQTIQTSRNSRESTHNSKI